MAYEYKITRQVEFVDTDMAGIMHFTNFFRFMETAEHAFYRSLGFSVDMEKSLGLGWPRVKAACEYKKPLRFEDTVEIHLLVREVRNRSICFEFIFRKADGDQSVEVARGQLTVVCVTSEAPSNEMRATAIPQAVRDKIQAAPPELIAE